MQKRLIVCLDGTWNKPETGKGKGRGGTTNVLKLLRALKTTGDDGATQAVYYDRGVGTEGWLDKFAGGAFGKGLSRNVKDAYRWVANNYDDGDRLYFFGFSRGAYTARSLAGLIGAVGLMSKLEVGQLPEAYGYYRTKPGERTSHPYHGTVAGRHKPPIAVVGVWDTVGSLGIPSNAFYFFNKRFAFHDVELGTGIENAFHALAVDERRKPFAPTIWEKPDGWAGRLEQVWFAGAHSNVGGGYADARLSDLAFLWMVEKARSCGLDFDSVYLQRFVNRPPLHDGHMGDEFKGIYRLLGPAARDVLEDPARGMTVDPSVLARAGDPALGYHPHNVRDLDRLLERSEAAE